MAKRGSITDALFEAVDSNCDGFITREEFRQAMKDDIVRVAGPGDPPFVGTAAFNVSSMPAVAYAQPAVGYAAAPYTVAAPTVEYVTGAAPYTGASAYSAFAQPAVEYVTAAPGVDYMTGGYGLGSISAAPVTNYATSAFAAPATTMPITSYAQPTATTSFAMPTTSYSMPTTSYAMPAVSEIVPVTYAASTAFAAPATTSYSTSTALPITSYAQPTATTSYAVPAVSQSVVAAPVTYAASTAFAAPATTSYSTSAALPITSYAQPTATTSYAMPTVSGQEAMYYSVGQADWFPCSVVGVGATGDVKVIFTPIERMVSLSTMSGLSKKRTCQFT